MYCLYMRRPVILESEDFVDQAQQAVTVIWDMTMKGRKWVASVSDLINRGSDPRRGREIEASV